MKRKVLSLLIIFFLLLSMFNSNAYAKSSKSGRCGDEFSWKIKNKTMTISNADSIGKWFHYKDAYGLDFSDPLIEKIVLSKGINVVYTEAFHCLRNIKSVQLPTTLQAIGKYAFEECSISNIVIPASVTFIRDGAFKDCKKLTKIYFLGDAPSPDYYEIFDNVTATVFYPEGNNTYTDSIRSKYGSSLKWKEWLKRSAIKSIILNKNKATVKWKGISGCSGYELQYATNNSFRKAKKKTINKSEAVTIKNIKNGAKYYFRVRPYYKISGEKYYSKWSKLKQFTV